MADDTVIVFFGPNGCGKDTQAGLLVKNFGFAHISTGQICRNTQDPEILATIARGKCIDDSKMLRMLTEHESFNAPRVIINGFPRTRSQVRMLYNVLGGRKTIFLRLNTTREIAERRISTRFANGKSNGQIRPDDDLTIARERLNDYYKQESLICRRANDFWQVVSIPNDIGSIGDVADLITSALIDAKAIDAPFCHHDFSRFEAKVAFTHLALCGDPTRIFH